MATEPTYRVSCPSCGYGFRTAGPAARSMRAALLRIAEIDSKMGVDEDGHPAVKPGPIARIALAALSAAREGER